MAELSFIVIAYNERATIERTLRSISTQHGLPSYEVIVVDDASSDGTAQLAEAYASVDPAVTVIALPENRGRGHARATGIGAAKGKLLAMVDGDIVLPADWYSRCRAELDSHDAVAGIAVPDGDVAYVHSLVGLEPRPARHSQQVTGSNALFRRSVFEQVEFDPSLREGEDVALNHAMRAAGTSMKTVDGVVVRHEEDKGLWASVKWLFESGLGASRQFRRYRELRAPDLSFAGWLASLALAGVAARRMRRLSPSALPLAYACLASAVRLREKFVVTSAVRYVAAIAVDAGMLTAYFVGRLVGIAKR